MYVPWVPTKAEQSYLHCRTWGALYLEQLVLQKDLWLQTCGSEEVYTNKLPFSLLPSSSCHRLLVSIQAFVLA